MTTTSIPLVHFPSAGPLGVLKKFRSNPAALFEEMKTLDAPLVKFRIAHKKLIYVTEFETAREVMRLSKLYQKSLPSAIGKLLGNGLVFAEGEEWSQQRRILSPAFHHRAIQGYINIMYGRAKDMVDKLQGQDSMAWVDMSAVFHEIAIQVVRDCLFGTHNDATELAVVLDGTLFLLEHAMNIRKNPLSPPLWFPSPGNLKAANYQKEIERVVLNAIEEKRTAATRDHTMLEMMLWERDQETEGTLKYQNIIDQVKIFFVAGTDTSANTLTWAFYELARHPEVLAEVMEEVDRVLDGKPIQMEDVPKLRKLKNVVHETLRLYPATWISSRKPIQEVTLANVTIPASTTLILSPYMILRDPELWENPNEFRPDRFEEFDEMPQAFIPFLMGPRKCIGDQFAMTEVMVSLATFIQHFTWELPKGYLAEVNFSATLSVKGAMDAKLKPRNMS